MDLLGDGTSSADVEAFLEDIFSFHGRRTTQNRNYDSIEFKCVQIVVTVKLTCTVESHGLQIVSVEDGGKLDYAYYTIVIHEI